MDLRKESTGNEVKRGPAGLDVNLAEAHAIHMASILLRWKAMLRKFGLSNFAESSRALRESCSIRRGLRRDQRRKPKGHLDEKLLELSETAGTKNYWLSRQTIHKIRLTTDHAFSSPHRVIDRSNRVNNTEDNHDEASRGTDPPIGPAEETDVITMLNNQMKALNQRVAKKVDDITDLQNLSLYPDARLLIGFKLSHIEKFSGITPPHLHFRAYVRTMQFYGLKEDHL
ncbi:hypothetical protein LguiA_025620 [Lonicera macranthoides]